MNENQPCRTSADVAGYCLTHAQRLAFCLVDKDLTISTLRDTLNDAQAELEERPAINDEMRLWRGGGS